MLLASLIEHIQLVLKRVLPSDGYVTWFRTGTLRSGQALEDLVCHCTRCSYTRLQVRYILFKSVVICFRLSFVWSKWDIAVQHGPWREEWLLVIQVGICGDIWFVVYTSAEVSLKKTIAHVCVLGIFTRGVRTACLSSIYTNAIWTLVKTSGNQVHRVITFMTTSMSCNVVI